MKKILILLLLTISFVGFGQNSYNIDETDYIYEKWEYGNRSWQRIELVYLKKDKTLVNGVVFSKYSNGQLKEMVNYKDGKKEGLLKEFYKNGQLKNEIKYKDGKNDGFWKGCRENGQLWFEGGHNKFLQKEGLHKTYWENGKLKFEGSWKKLCKWALKSNSHKTHKDGLHKTYWENGQLESEVNYECGSFEGLWRGYYKNGKLKFERNYENNEQISEKCWDKNGKKID